MTSLTPKHNLQDRILSVSIHDCKVSTFSSGGAGGQHRDHSNSGVLVQHEPSGASGRATDSRSQQQNRRNAFLRMIDTPEFRAWLYATTRNLKTPKEIEQEVQEDMNPHNLKIEIKEKGKWVEQ